MTCRSKEAFRLSTIQINDAMLRKAAVERDRRRAPSFAEQSIFVSRDGK
jgi:hypothetical protein